MGGSVFQDKKTKHWFIQIRWDGKTERFYRYEFRGVWFSFSSEEQARKILSVMQSEIDAGNFNPASYRTNSPLAIAQYVETWLSLADVVKNTSMKRRG